MVVEQIILLPAPSYWLVLIFAGQPPSSRFAQRSAMRSRSAVSMWGEEPEKSASAEREHFAAKPQ